VTNLDINYKIKNINI